VLAFFFSTTVLAYEMLGLIGRNAADTPAAL
jgi:hypothetical protein